MSELHDASCWVEWFKTNCPKIPASFREIFSAKLIENQVVDSESLQEVLEVDPNFLKTSIGVKNTAFEISIKKQFTLSTDCDDDTSSELTHMRSISPLSVMTSSMSKTVNLDGLSQETGEFKPSVNVGDDSAPVFIAITNLVLFRATTNTRAIYFGEYTVTKKHHQVVIKMESNEQLIHEMEHEALVLADLASKNNQSCIDLVYYHDKGPYYTVTERFGENMSAFLHRNSSIKSQLLEQLVLSVKGLHGDGYVHCDLKPENVLVHMQAGVIKVKLCDLDSARKVGDLFPYDEESGGLKYTYEWVSPEVYFGSGGVTRAQYGVDIFALGLIAAVLFDDEVSENKTILPRRNEDPSLLSHFLSNQEVLNTAMPCQCNTRYRHAIHSMCVLDPKQRATLHDVLAALELNRTTAYQKRAELAEEKVDDLRKNNEFLKEEVIDKQTQILVKLDDLKEQLQITGQLVRDVLKQNDELRGLVETIISGCYDLPTLFVCVPELANRLSNRFNPLQFVQDRYRLFFMCAHTKKIVRCGPDGNGFLISVSKDWVKKSAPYLKVGLLMMKEMLQLYQVPLPFAPLMNLFSDDLEVHSKYICCALTGMSIATVDISLNAVKASATPTLSTRDEIRSIDTSQLKTRESYEDLKKIIEKISQDGSVASTLAISGLEQVSYKGNVAWIEKSEDVKRSYIAACDKKAMKAEASRMASSSARIVPNAAIAPASSASDGQLRSRSTSLSATATAPPMPAAAPSAPPASAPSYQQPSRSVSFSATSASPMYVAPSAPPAPHPNTAPNYQQSPQPLPYSQGVQQYPNLSYRYPPSAAVAYSASCTPQTMLPGPPVYVRMERSASAPQVVNLQYVPVYPSYRPTSGSFCYSSPAPNGTANVVYATAPPAAAPSVTPPTPTANVNTNSTNSNSNPRYRAGCWTCCLRRRDDPGCHFTESTSGWFSKKNYDFFHVGQYRTEPMLITDRDIMMAFYHTTNGAKWTWSTNWGSNEPLSKWYGLATDANMNVVAIDLRNNNIHGVLPEDFSLLTHLTYLRIDGNVCAHIIGTLPASYCSLQALKKISLKFNRLTGRMPESWRALHLENANMHSLNMEFANNIAVDFKFYQPKCKLKMWQ